MNEMIWKDIGSDLVQYSYEEADFSKQRGLVAELFPYIFEASKRMSTRAISNWLKNERKIELSAATIAKALREKDKHIQSWMDEIEPSARYFAEAHQTDIRSVLFLTDEEFEEICQGAVLTGGKTHEEQADEYFKYDGIKDYLASEWFSLPEATRTLFAHHFLKTQGAFDDKEEEDESENAK